MSRRSAQAVESTLSTTPTHQDSDHVGSGLAMTDVSPPSLSTKRIKTSDATSNGRSARKVTVELECLCSDMFHLGMLSFRKHEKIDMEVHLLPIGSPHHHVVIVEKNSKSLLRFVHRTEPIHFSSSHSSKEPK